MFSECFKVFLALFDIWAENRIFEPRTGFQKFLKKPQNMFSWCFLSVSRYFSIVRNLCWEPHFWAEKRIFKNFSKSLKTCFVGVFWVFRCIFFSIVRHLSREPDFWAENQIFKKFLKSLKTCLVGVFWVFHGVFFSVVRHLSREPDFWAENSVFKTFFKSL